MNEFYTSHWIHRMPRLIQSYINGFDASDSWIQCLPLTELLTKKGLDSIGVSSWTHETPAVATPGPYHLYTPKRSFCQTPNRNQINNELQNLLIYLSNQIRKQILKTIQIGITDLWWSYDPSRHDQRCQRNK